MKNRNTELAPRALNRGGTIAGLPHFSSISNTAVVSNPLWDRSLRAALLSTRQAPQCEPVAFELAILALRLRYELGDDTEFFVTNGPSGLAWIEWHWWPFDLLAISCLLTGPIQAFDAATRIAAHWGSQPLAVGAFRNGEALDRNAFGGGSCSWAEIAL